MDPMYLYQDLVIPVPVDECKFEICKRSTVSVGAVSRHVLQPDSKRKLQHGMNGGMFESAHRMCNTLGLRFEKATTLRRSPSVSLRDSSVMAALLREVPRSQFTLKWFKVSESARPKWSSGRRM